MMVKTSKWKKKNVFLDQSCHLTKKEKGSRPYTLLPFTMSKAIAYVMKGGMVIYFIMFVNYNWCRLGPDARPETNPLYAEIPKMAALKMSPVSV